MGAAQAGQSQSRVGERGGQVEFDEPAELVRRNGFHAARPDRSGGQNRGVEPAPDPVQRAERGLGLEVVGDVSLVPVDSRVAFGGRPARHAIDRKDPEPVSSCAFEDGRSNPARGAGEQKHTFVWIAGRRRRWHGTRGYNVITLGQVSGACEPLLRPLNRP